MTLSSGVSFEENGGREADLSAGFVFSDIIGVHPIFGGFLVG